MYFSCSSLPSFPSFWWLDSIESFAGFKSDEFNKLKWGGGYHTTAPCCNTISTFSDDVWLRPLLPRRPKKKLSRPNVISLSCHTSRDRLGNTCKRLSHFIRRVDLTGLDLPRGVCVQESPDEADVRRVWPTANSHKTKTKRTSQFMPVSSTCKQMPSNVYI